MEHYTYQQLQDIIHAAKVELSMGISPELNRARLQQAQAILLRKKAA